MSLNHIYFFVTAGGDAPHLATSAETTEVVPQCHVDDCAAKAVWSHQGNDVAHGDVAQSSTSQQINDACSRTSSPGSNDTDSGTNSSSDTRLNPLAAEFEPQRKSFIIPPSIELRNTESRGHGLFAVDHIPIGTCIILEAPLLSISDQSVHFVWGPYTRLGNSQKLQFDSLHAFQSKQSTFEQASRLYLLDPNDEAMDEDDIEEAVAEHVRVMSIFAVNNMKIPKGRRAIFATYSRLNHSCIPNVYATFHNNLEKITVHAVRDISAGEEILTTYLGAPAHYHETSKRQAKLSADWGFTCTCEACSDTTGASDARRVTLSHLAWGINRFQAGAPAKNPYIPASHKSALLQAEDLLSLMLQEGIVTNELAKTYRLASTQALALRNYDKAVEYARNEVTVERNCVGTEVSVLIERGVAAECWKNDILRKIKCDVGWAKLQMYLVQDDPAEFKKKRNNNKHSKKKQTGDSARETGGGGHAQAQDGPK